MATKRKKQDIPGGRNYNAYSLYYKISKTELETRYNRVFILLHKPHDATLYVLLAVCGEVSPLSA